MDNNIFPKVKREISSFLTDQEGNIPRSKILTVGSMVILLGIVFAQDVFAAHRSHSSHSSHRSHSSGSGGHSSHESHVSHSSHVSGSGSHSSSSGYGGSSGGSYGGSYHDNVTTKYVPSTYYVQTPDTLNRTPDVSLPSTSQFVAPVFGSVLETNASLTTEARTQSNVEESTTVTKSE